MNKRYKVGAYLRLSKKDDESDVSNSIINQKTLIDNCIKINDELELVDYYIDDGYSGTTLERPSFLRLIEDINFKKINCIIVKDLSRLARNYNQLGTLLEEIFPRFGIRVICINNSYDNKDNVCEVNDEIPLNNLVNDYYAKDISRKVKSVLNTKRENGEFIGSFAPYGYQKDKNNKHKFIVDKEASEIVGKIFDMYLNGSKKSEIAEFLNKNNILTPNEYLKGAKASITKKWNGDTVSRILINETYTGVLIQGKNKRINYKIKKQVQTEESEWFIAKNHHDSIISEEVFEKVQHSLSRKKDYSKNADILNGYLKCIDCSSGLTVRKSKGKTYYNCSSYIRNKGCKSHSIKREKLIELIIDDINKKKQSNIFELTSNIINEFIDKISVIDKTTIEVIYK